MNPYITIAVIFAVLAISFSALLYYLYKTCFSPHRADSTFDFPRTRQYKAASPVMIPLINDLLSREYEEVHITSSDSKKLFGRYYHVRDGAPLQIQFHGYRGSGLRDFCGGCKLARDAGHNMLLVDQRAHGKSEGRAITFGVKERYDCLCWINYARERFGKDTPIILSGVSMGGTTVLMASGLDLPENVKAIIADCPYSSPEAIIRKVCRDRGFPDKLVYPLIRLSALLFAGFDPNSFSAVQAVTKSRVPILIMHGEDDLFVPCDMSREIFDACTSAKMRLTVPGAGHGLSYIVDREKYTSTLTKFLHTYM